jgi:FkbM family methyltransferase
MRLRDAIADSLGALLGRRRFARLARFLWLRSRLDVRNELHENGERKLQEAVLRRAAEAGSGTIFDIGANVGQWTSSLLDVAGRVGVPHGGLSLHLFEPAPEAADALERVLQDLPSNVSAVLNRVAVAAEGGRREFHMVGPTAGTNSLFESPAATSQRIEVRCITLDRYCRDNGIRRVDLCKIDTEGADYLVLQGGIESLRSGVLKCVQFEYNQRWIQSRHFLRDVFELTSPMGLEVGKVTPRGIERYQQWDPELECFREGNYVLAGDLESLGMAVFPWWKESA